LPDLPPGHRSCGGRPHRGRALSSLEERGFVSDHQEAVAKVAELAKGIRIAMLTTVDEEGHLVARPMAQQEVEFDGDLWFFAERDSSTVTQLQSNPHVGVSLSSSDTWVSICGTAQVVHDPAKAHELWNSAVEAWFPQGPDDAGVALIKVTADGAEYWDTPGGRVASILSFVKAKVTGHPYDGGENEKVDL
jgi:general stress protein 26